jgi:hypothetical protein
MCPMSSFQSLQGELKQYWVLGSDIVPMKASETVPPEDLCCFGCHFQEYILEFSFISPNNLKNMLYY